MLKTESQMTLIFFMHSRKSGFADSHETSSCLPLQVYFHLSPWWLYIGCDIQWSATSSCNVLKHQTGRFVGVLRRAVLICLDNCNTVPSDCTSGPAGFFVILVNLEEPNVTGASLTSARRFASHLSLLYRYRTVWMFSTVEVLNFVHLTGTSPVWKVGR